MRSLHINSDHFKIRRHAFTVLILFLIPIFSSAQSDTIKKYINPKNGLAFTVGSYFDGASLCIAANFERLLERYDNPKRRFGFSIHASFLDLPDLGLLDLSKLYGLSARGVILRDFSNGNGHCFEFQAGPFILLPFEEGRTNITASILIGYRYDVEDSPVSLRVGSGFPELMYVGTAIQLD